MKSKEKGSKIQAFPFRELSHFKGLYANIVKQVTPNVVMPAQAGIQEGSSLKGVGKSEFRAG